MNIPEKSTKKLALFIIAVFCIFFSLESLVNHYYFRTHALDLGMVNNALYDYARLHSNDCTLLFETISQDFLSCHFSLYPILISPLSYAFGSYTLLIFQIAAVLWGGWGIYSYFSWKFSHSFLPVLAMLHFFLAWGIYSALSFDYHDNVVAAMLVPWLLFHFEKQQKTSLAIYFLLLLVSKENMALWAIFIAIGLGVQHWKTKESRVMAFIMASFALLYFILAIKVFMPIFDHTKQSEIAQISRYSALGNSWTQIALSVFTHPKHFLTIFFTNTTGETCYNGIKTELHYMVLLAGGWALLFKPHYLIMLIPIYAQKMLSSDYGMWGINNQYSIEFIPILTLASFTLIGSLQNRRNQIIIGSILVFITTLSTCIKFNTRESKWYDQTNTVFFRKKHFQEVIPVKEAYKLIQSIPENAVVSTHSDLLPHLAFREKIYCFPRVLDARYVLVPISNARISTWPQNSDEYAKAIKDLVNSGEWEILYKSDHFLLLKRLQVRIQ